MHHHHNLGRSPVAGGRGLEPGFIPEEGPEETPTIDGPQEPQNSPNNSYNNCWEFVDHLVGLAMATNSSFESPDSILARQRKRSKSRRLGNDLIKEALDYKFINNHFGGIKDTLTMGFQNAGVYGHVLGQSGEIFKRGWCRTSGGAVARAYDQVQEKFPEIYPHNQNDQRAAEIAGNAAGIEVGKQIWSYLTGH